MANCSIETIFIINTLFFSMYLLVENGPNKEEEEEF